MAEKTGEATEMNLPENVREFYQEKARMENRSLSEEVNIALQEHMDMLQQQSHKPTPGNDTVGGYRYIDTPSIPY